MRATWISTDRILALPRSYKRLLALLADCSLCVLTVWLAICFRFESWVTLSGYQWLAVFLSIFLAIPLLAAFGFYQTVVRFVGWQVIGAAFKAMGIYMVIYSAVFTAYGLPLVPRTIGILQPMLLLLGLAFLRLSARQLLGESAQTLTSQQNLPAVVIYGAGNSGQQLASSLLASGKSRVIGYIDDDRSLHGARIANIHVYSPAELAKLVQEHKIHDVLLAIPSLSRSRRNDIIKILSKFRIAVRTLPSLSDLAQGKITEKDLREIDIEDLLGRDAVEPIHQLLIKNITAKVVMVTGAGGSIGSELCRQIIKLGPKQLILLDLSEFALYRITEELAALELPKSVLQTPILANAQDLAQISQLIQHYRPHTIYHAAAYKHVPLVETNRTAGLRNNILSTLNIAQSAIEHGVEDIVFISTDKAVRPTNIMGASKRISEMVLQHIASIHKNKPHSTRISMVRFGNVLGSSGSVIPKFREQINHGGPITLTHKDITRYFMTIPEAAQLVIQASALTTTHQNGAKTYLLDMGESIKILELAKTMVQLCGLTVKDEINEEGDIAIKITGLRPGEKLFEELLISGTFKETPHPKIKIAEDAHNDQSIGFLEQVISLCETNSTNQEIAKKITAFDIGYEPQ
jgi:FlaA1/EpsC-like NDP-sugar epimerase